jgi:7-carboxy-7-deazaguanine synthase
MTTSVAAVRRAPSETKVFPIIEIFGPTIQGEGAEAGIPTHFVRVGGCDYRCAWCDTMYAVDPAAVRATAEWLRTEEIVTRVAALKGRPLWTTISGGNPALHELGPIVGGLQRVGFRVAVETQGSVWKPWLADVDRLTISPKPPSSEMAGAAHVANFDRFMAAAAEAALARAILKVVVFDEEDLAWATAVAERFPFLPLYLSSGTPVPAGADVRRDVGARYRWLCGRVAVEPALSRARVLPQLHVIAWEAATGV